MLAFSCPVRACSVRPELALATLTLLALPLGGCSDDDDRHGPYWEGTHVVPNFAVRHNELSTSFEGYIDPKKSFVFGAGEAFTFDKPNARLTVNANSVWAYAPIVVGLYDGPRERVGGRETLVVGWQVPMPREGDVIEFVESAPLGDRKPLWAVVEFPDFSGVAILQVLGHD